MLSRREGGGTISVGEGLAILAIVALIIVVILVVAVVFVIKSLPFCGLVVVPPLALPSVAWGRARAARRRRGGTAGPTKAK